MNAARLTSNVRSNSNQYIYYVNIELNQVWKATQFTRTFRTVK
jgi:hypothetical protein